MGQTARLARYVCSLDYTAIPAEVVQRAKDCLLDSIGVGFYGSIKPWGKIVGALVRDRGGKGSSSIFGEPVKVSAASATLANGTMIHGFELDNVRQPGAGVHAGATIVPALLAVSEEAHATGKDFLTALVAGCEAMFRIGLALGHGAEKRGFHAPGLTGTFGAATAVGKVLGLNVEQMIYAMGISGSLSSGLLEFSRATTGGMVKRLHLGRAAEGGLMAALLACRGFRGPETILEGEFGFCRVYSDSPQPGKLTAGLGEDFETLNICIKRFPCHIYAQAPIEALLCLKRDYSFRAEEVEKIIVAGEEKLTTHHAIYEPKDVMMAQYSVPYSVALALWTDPEDPENFSEQNLSDPKILEVARRVELLVDERISQVKESRAARVTVRLKGGRELKHEVMHFRGTPERPLVAEELDAKVERLTRHTFQQEEVRDLIEKVRHLEELKDMGTLL
ncbi:MAG: MmgE/PrpD family protein [Candidatus Binatia bacterium]